METAIKVSHPSRRLWAFLVDVVPITVALFFLFYFTTHFKETVDRFLSDTRTFDDRRQFLEERNRIRDLSAVIYLLYAAVMESSAFGGTFGKKLLGVRVVGRDGERISFRRAFGRNLLKMFSVLPAFVGCVAAFRNQKRQAWHDKFANTYVVIRETEN